MLDPYKDFPTREEDRNLLDCLKNYRYSAYYLNAFLERGGNLQDYDLTKLLNTHLRDGGTILFDSITQNHPHGYPKVTKFLLEKGADPNLTTKPYGLTPLQNAVFRGNQQITELLIKHNVNVNAQDQEGKTALHDLLHKPVFTLESLNLVKYLLKNGADVNIKDKWGKTPLDIMKSQNIYNDELNKDMAYIKETPLNIMKSQNIYNDELYEDIDDIIVKLEKNPPKFMDKTNTEVQKLESDILLDLENLFRKSAIVVNLLEALDRCDWQKMVICLEQAILHNYNLKYIINTPEDNYGYTMLIRAVNEGHIGAVDFLVKSGADINIVDYDGFGPLHYAILHSEWEIIKIIVNGGANVNLKNGDGLTPLHSLTYPHQYTDSEIKTIKFLLENGANVNIKDNAHETPSEMMQSAGIDINTLLDNNTTSHSDITYHTSEVKTYAADTPILGDDSLNDQDTKMIGEIEQ